MLLRAEHSKSHSAVRAEFAVRAYHFFSRPLEKRKLMNRCALLLVTVASLLPFPAFAQTTQRYIVMTRQSAPQALRALRNDDWEPRDRSDVHEFKYIDGFAADLTADDLAKLKASSNVRWIEPVLERHLLSDTITAGAQTTAYGINMVHAPEVWPVTKGASTDSSKPIRVAVIDTGVRYTESDLKNAYKGGHNFINGSDNPLDDNGHGTHVSGIIAAADDGDGVVGVAPQVELYGLKVLDQCGSGSTENVIQAVEWILTKKSQIGGNWIINLSLGSDSPSEAERTEFQRAADAGVLTFAASGNDYDTNPVDGLSYPAGYSTVVSVGAIDAASAVAGFSQRGSGLQVVAPGVSVLSTYVSGSLVTNDGRIYQVNEMDAKKSNGDSFCFSRPNITNTFVFCGRGNPADFPASVSGKIALIERGDLTFADKAKNAKAAGAVGVVIYNNKSAAEENGGLFSGTLGTLTSTSQVPYTVSISQEDGLAIKATPNATLTISYGYEGFALLNGTSMASPHAAGVAALVWASAPSASANAVAQAIEATAGDLGNAGYDTVYGNGLVNALNAAKQLNPTAFGSGATPSSKPVTGRVPGRRGH
jgi:subtilisin family serine protease